MTTETLPPVAHQLDARLKKLLPVDDTSGLMAYSGLCLNKGGPDYWNRDRPDYWFYVEGIDCPFDGLPTTARDITLLYHTSVSATDNECEDHDIYQVASSLVYLKVSRAGNGDAYYISGSALPGGAGSPFGETWVRACIHDILKEAAEPLAVALAALRDTPYRDLPDTTTLAALVA